MPFIERALHILDQGLLLRNVVRTFHRMMKPSVLQVTKPWLPISFTTYTTTTTINNNNITTTGVVYLDRAGMKEKLSQQLGGHGQGRVAAAFSPPGPLQVEPI